MAFCGNCGKEVPEGVSLCQDCAANLGTQTEKKDAEDNKAMGILAYIIFFIPMLTESFKTSPFVRYHTNQGTVLIIIDAVWFIVGIILGFIPILGALISFLGNIALLILHIIGIVNAVNGKMQPVPVVGELFTIIK